MSEDESAIQVSVGVLIMGRGVSAAKYAMVK